jgi:hypothetical protein
MFEDTPLLGPLPTPASWGEEAKRRSKKLAQPASGNRLSLKKVAFSKRDTENTDGFWALEPILGRIFAL